MSERKAVAPCVFPRCDDGNGDAALTTQVMCDRCRRHYRKVLDWLVLDYVMLRMEVPSPIKPSGQLRGAPSKEYGHPAEWASDTAAEIASCLNWIEDGLRDHLRHEPAIHPFASEPLRVANGHKYLTDQFHRLCQYPAAGDSAVEIDDLHHKIRKALGYTRLLQQLPCPCPVCDVAALVRDVGSITCGECGKVIDEKHYDWLAGWLVDRLINEYDTRKTAELA